MVSVTLQPTQALTLSRNEKSAGGSVVSERCASAVATIRRAATRVITRQGLSKRAVPQTEVDDANELQPQQYINAPRWLTRDICAGGSPGDPLGTWHPSC